MRTAFIFLVTMTMLANESKANIRTEWIHIDDGMTMERAIVLETDGHRLFAGTTNGVYISLDNGYTWRLTLDVNDCTAITIHQNTVYAGTFYDGVFRSDNHGETWKPINNGIRTINVDNGEIRLPHIEQILVTSSGTVVAVGYHSGTHTSTDRGETWHDVTLEWKVRRREAPDWIIGDSIWSMTEFDGYLWSAYSRYQIYRSPDNGQTWEHTREFVHGRVADWAVLNDRLYVATDEGLARWNEEEPAWEELTEGLPVPSNIDRSEIQNLAVNRGRIFAGLTNFGVYMFDDRIDTFVPAGLQGLTVTALVDPSIRYNWFGRFLCQLDDVVCWE